MEVQTAHTGRVIFYLPDKGYGYVRLEGTHEEFHFRTKNLRYTLPVADDLVTFTIRQTGQGYYADNISRANLA